MSDYQRVRLLQKKGRVLTIEVEEANPDVGALAAVVSKGRLLGDKKKDAIKLAALLLLDEKARAGDIVPASDEPPAPEDFVSKVALQSAEKIGDDVDGEPRYRAVLEITVTRSEYADAFDGGEEWGAAAELGCDFDDCFS